MLKRFNYKMYDFKRKALTDAEEIVRQDLNEIETEIIQTIPVTI